jgi:galactose-1-phosphate uridylyltransferase
MRSFGAFWEAGVEFPKEVREARFMSLQRGGKTDIAQIEYRQDPLTGGVSRLNVARAQRVRQAGPLLGGSDIRDVLDRSRLNCMFCPRNIEKATPEFPPDVWPDRRIARGQTLIFPNLYPFAEHHAVGVISHEHHLNLNQFPSEMLADNFAASQVYCQTINQRYPEARCAHWVWNDMPPSAASIIHPHMQIMLERTPTAGLAKLLEASALYAKQHGTNFWADLIDAEAMLKQRMIFQNEWVAVLASFAPHGTREIQFITKNVSNFANLSADHIKALASALSIVLRAYHAAGVNSFNVVSYSAALGESAENFWLSFRIVSRPRFQAFYTSDSGFIERFYGESIVDTMPEDVAANVRAFFEAR